MSEPTAYSTIVDVLSDRTRWAMCMLHALAQRARREGWLEGTPQDSVHPELLAREIAERTARSPLDPRLVPMQWLALRLRLDPYELDAVWLLACIELAPSISRLAEVFGSAEITVQILQQLVPIPQRSLDTLHRLALIELQTAPDVPHQRRRVRIHDRVLALVRGELDVDADLAALAALHTVTSVRATEDARSASFVIGVGPVGAGRTTMLAASVARGTLRVDSPKLAKDPSSLRRRLRAIAREAYLFDVVPLFRDLDDDVVRSAVEEVFEDFGGSLMATSSTPFACRHRAVVCHHVERPSSDTRLRCWRAALGAGVPTEVVEDAASRYLLWPGSIEAAARNALSAANGVVDTTAIHAGVRAHLGEQLGTLATRIEWAQTWSDLVLPSDQVEQLVELVARVRHRDQVLGEWGFGAKVGKGHGIAALLSGPPGTGKTMVAGLLAKELGLDLYQVDLSKIVSKYIGETEKQLGALFDAAETGHAIVLFDEADSLFAKRSDVKSSNDRYANLEVNYLLQRLEAFTGVAILTTNHERTIDEAFKRRLAIHIRFPTPDESQREMLWQALLPSAAPVSTDIDFRRLADDFDLTGGYIKNAVLRAAYLAAREDSAISMLHLYRAARLEVEGLGKVIQRAA